MKPVYIHKKNNKEYFFQEGCYITELSNTSADEDVSIAQARVEVGQTTKWHKLTTSSERYVIISGQGKVEIGEDSPQEVSAGDVVIIPPNCKQRIENIGQEDLVFLAICSPRFDEKNYTEEL